MACFPPIPSQQTPTPPADTFLHYRTSKVRALRAARLERLVRELVSGDHDQDPGFVPAFLATHRAFVPTTRVLGFLLPPPPPPPPPPPAPSRLVANKILQVPFSRSPPASPSLLGFERRKPSPQDPPPSPLHLAAPRPSPDGESLPRAESKSERQDVRFDKNVRLVFPRSVGEGEGLQGH
jgi:hypothetical protein